MRRELRSVAFPFLLVSLLAGTHTAQAATQSAGPPLSVAGAKLDAALECSGGVGNVSRAPVLLVPGTTLDPGQFDWNYVPALRERGVPYCTVALPGNGMRDIQVAAEYVVHAIRTMHADSGREVRIIGHSQGGMVPRWALKFWPGTRKKVDDLVGLAPSNHGTLDAAPLCLGACAPAIHQQKLGSNFLAALNAGAETFAGISYTNVYSRLDEVVVPNFGSEPSSALHTGEGEITNIAIQEVCPADVAEHLITGTSDPVAYALAIDALTHPGPADPARLPADVCSRPFMPGVDPVTFPTNMAHLGATAAGSLATSGKVASEPALKDYADSRSTGE